MNKTLSHIALCSLILILLGTTCTLAGPASGATASRSTLLAETPDQYAWTLETVAERAGRSPSLVLDALGQPRIACMGYYGEHDYGVLYLRYENFSWHSEMVDENGSDYVSLALDTNGEPHISYYNISAADLMYAHYYGGAWHIQHVEPISGTGHPYTSIQVDSTGMPHIAFGDPSNGAIRYTRRVGPTWQTETIAVVGGLGDEVSLVLDAQDHPHIAYHDDALDALRYAYHDGTSWHIETVDDATFAGEHNALVLDTQGHPHIAYYAWGLRYAWHDGASWHTTTLADDHLAGDYVSLGLDHFGRPHISSVTWDYPDERWLRHSYFDGLDWQQETLDVQTGSAWYRGTSLALDAADRIHIAYWDTGPEGDYLQHAVYREPCTPVSGASITGPDRVPLGVPDDYAATYTPPEASTPVLYAWNNGATGATAAYSWTVAGSYSVTVTATNACGQAQDAMVVEVFCQPLTGAHVVGPSSLLAGQSGTFQAVAEPITASLPLTVTWDNGSSGPTASYSWPTTGTYTLTMTATNPCGIEQGGSFQVSVLAEWPYAAYLPLLSR